MKTISYNYRSGKEIIPDDIYANIKGIIENIDRNIGRYEIKHFKNDLIPQLYMNGWSAQVPVSTVANITITSVKNDIGLCIQTGNMARMYADMMKLQAMYMDNHIKAAIFVLPTKACAVEFGGNVANYERFYNELTNIFSKVITVPMAIIGFDNEE